MGAEAENAGITKPASKLTIRDIMTAAAMLVLSMVTNALIAGLMLPIPVAYLYIAAPIEMFVAATFYLVAAHRINKHGLLFLWATVQGLVFGIFGYPFLIPYFLIVGVVCELAMIGKDSYRTTVRNGLGWGLLGVGMVIGNAVPLWFAWDSFKANATRDGFSSQVIDMMVDLSTNPLLLALACLLTLIGSFLGVLFGYRLLRRHFRKAGVVE